MEIPTHQPTVFAVPRRAGPHLAFAVCGALGAAFRARQITIMPTIRLWVFARWIRSAASNNIRQLSHAAAFAHATARHWWSWRRCGCGCGCWNTGRACKKVCKRGDDNGPVCTISRIIVGNYGTSVGLYRRACRKPWYNRVIRIAAERQHANQRCTPLLNAGSAEGAAQIAG